MCLFFVTLHVVKGSSTGVLLLQEGTILPLHEDAMTDKAIAAECNRAANQQEPQPIAHTALEDGSSPAAHVHGACSSFYHCIEYLQDLLAAKLAAATRW